MEIMSYILSNKEKERLREGIQTALSVPFIDDIEDYIWESIFCYVKDIPLVDPLTSIRSKRLFDVVDEKNRIGWSAKSLLWSVQPGCEFELVIQRADIFKKAEALGYPNGLTKNSPTEQLGEALLKHWSEEKVKKDAEYQGVDEKRVCILLKSRDRKKFAYFEEDLAIYKPSDLEWHWTDETKTGLQGVRKSDGFRVFRWYPNQTQFFERFLLPEDIFTFELEPQRLPMEVVVQKLKE